MNGSWFFEQNFNGVPDDFFDDASLKYFDLPLEDVESNDAIEDWESQFQQLPTPSNLFADFTSDICHLNNDDTLRLKKSSVSNDKPSQPKPCVKSAETSSSGIIQLKPDSSESKHSHLFWTSSPVSVLESSSSSSSAETSTIYHGRFPLPVKRPRSKHSRNRRSEFPFMSTLSAPKHHPLGNSESESESYPDDKMLNLARQKKKLSLLSSASEMKKPSSKISDEIRKCTHCEVTKTPQWREGPMGPKTLCNACGVRYRSGRLFPEYRPVASPTFIPTLHSNSHRKVIEMRKNYGHAGITTGMKAPLSPLPEYSF